MTSPTFQLTLQNLKFERHDECLFQDIYACLQSGELLQIRGANGSGKSTLLRILAGLIEPQEGDVLWQGTSILKQPEEYQKNLLYMGHQHGVKPLLTVKENLHLFAALFGITQHNELLHTVIKRVGLQENIDKEASLLSAGQIRRLALARLLLKPVAVWILDEPLTALDSHGQELLHTLLNEHTEQGGIAIIATHQEFTGRAIELGKKFNAA